MAAGADGRAMNVFRRCLKKEFGKSQYGMYVTMCRKELKEQTDGQTVTLSGKAVYQDMYNHVRKMGQEEIARKKERLMKTMLQAFQIGKQFSFVFFFYLMASFLLIALNLQPGVTHVSLMLMGLCFLYKVYEFVCNRFCFVDAYLVMVYKTVLEKVSTPDTSCKQS